MAVPINHNKSLVFEVKLVQRKLLYLGYANFQLEQTAVSEPQNVSTCKMGAKFFRSVARAKMKKSDRVEEQDTLHRRVGNESTPASIVCSELIGERRPSISILA